MTECRRGEGPGCENFEAEVRKVLALKTIAVVGLSPKEDRPSFRVAKYLLEHGYDIVPVRPAGEEILGLKVYESLRSVVRPVDIVDVFRRSEDCEEIAREAVAIGAKVLWLQEDVFNPAAKKIAEDAGLWVVMDTCIKKMHDKYLGA